MRNTNNPPCKGCQDRVLACHERCEKYLSWKKMYEDGKNKYAGEAEKHMIENSIRMRTNEIRRKQRGRC